MRKIFLIFACAIFVISCGGSSASSGRGSNTDSKSAATSKNKTGLSYPIVATGQVQTFDDQKEIPAPKHGEPFYGQDAQFIYNVMSYTDNGDGTITDNNTALMWQKGYKVLDYEQALDELERLNKEDKYNDWRLPTMKQLYSIMNFNGEDLVSPTEAGDKKAIPFIDTEYFDFEYGSNGERPIDTQILSSSIYNSKTMGGAETVFGLNVADGRIKGYGMYMRDSLKPFTVRFVRGNKEYGINKFADNNNGTITDNATGLMWSKDDSERRMNWPEALAYVQTLNEQKYLGYSDWRLPNAKELHSILDYSRSPKITDSAAIDPIFNTTQIVVENGSNNYGEYWTSTTHKSMASDSGRSAVYINFGEAMGFMTVGGRGFSLSAPEGEPVVVDGTNYYLVDVHGAGSQRSDPKVGDPTVEYPHGNGPQGDAVRVYNLVRVVRSK